MHTTTETSMTKDHIDAYRRTLLQIAAGLAGAGQINAAGATETRAAPHATGKPGDFDFLSGHWKIRHRRLKDQVWDSFDGEASVFGILGGIASVEELRIPARNFSGMGLRLLDVERKLWADYWVGGQSGVARPPVWGSFADGAGTWDAEETEDGKPVIVRGMWDQITAQSCRWRQAVSRDSGISWDENWIMHWQRA
jgi:hypothetical protein